MREFTIAMLFAVTAALVPAALSLAPRTASPVTVVMPPWASEGDAVRVVAAADGTLIASARHGKVAIARFAAEDFVSSLYRAGALFVIDATAVIACFGFDRVLSTPTTRAPT